MRTPASIHRATVFSLGLLLLAGFTSRAAPHYLGAKSCQECHQSEYAVWEKSKHSLSFKDLHRRPKFNDILAAVGGDKNPRKNTVCVQCHFTPEQTSASSPATVRTSVSCESCHGPASEWRLVHNDYGGPGVSREAESPAHKAGRLEKSISMGMLRPGSLYDLAANCLNCHTLARPGLDPAIVGKMVAAGHPINPEYELVRFAQGTVRHRFYPPDTSKNAELTPAELARHYITGRAAMLVTVTQAAGKVNQPVYDDAIRRQTESARAAIGALKDIPEAAAFLATPTEAAARKLVAAVADKDLTPQVGGMLPRPADYK